MGWWCLDIRDPLRLAARRAGPGKEGGKGAKMDGILGEGGGREGPLCVCVPLPLGGSVAWRLYDVKPQGP